MRVATGSHAFTARLRHLQVDMRCGLHNHLPDRWSSNDMMQAQRETKYFFLLWLSAFAAPTVRLPCLMDCYCHLIDVLYCVFTPRCSAGGTSWFIPWHRTPQDDHNSSPPTICRLCIFRKYPPLAARDINCLFIRLHVNSPWATAFGPLRGVWFPLSIRPSEGSLRASQ